MTSAEGDVVSGNVAGDNAGGGSTKELHEVKVKLPVEQVLQLHYVRMKNRRTFSDVIGAALNVYMSQILSDEDPV